MAKQLTVELVREYPGRDGYFYADLALPAAAHEIRDALQKTRAADRADAYQDITVVRAAPCFRSLSASGWTAPHWMN